MPDLDKTNEEMTSGSVAKRRGRSKRHGRPKKGEPGSNHTARHERPTELVFALDIGDRKSVV